MKNNNTYYYYIYKRSEGKSYPIFNIYRTLVPKSKWKSDYGKNFNRYVLYCNHKPELCRTYERINTDNLKLYKRVTEREAEELLFIEHL